MSHVGVLSCAYHLSIKSNALIGSWVPAWQMIAFAS